MKRIKMAGGMLLGAVLLQVGFMACSASNTAGMMTNLFDGGAGDTGVLGGSDADAQTMPCTQWEVKIGPTATSTAAPVEAGWEPFAVITTSAREVIVRRCTAR
ncbi:MAG: hypothetical protein Q8S73_41650 [Deltaproteobacteria bacterium]|nr:hypothetical protein [Myxococcales bacterium]MDP3220665.1 hypothetical protein [Deltaproteobacteria bacterium]